MPRPCSICSHPQREEIEAALARGEPYASIAERHGVTKAALSRHRSHAAGATEGAAPLRYETERLEALKHNRLDTLEGVLEYVEALISTGLAILQEALERGRIGEALQAARVLHPYLALAAKLQEERPAGHPVDAQPILRSPEWVRIREAMARALEPFPEARDAIARALMEVEGRDRPPHKAS